MVMYLCILIMITIKITQKITIIKNRNIIIYTFGFIILIVSLIPQNLAQINFFENTIYKNIILYFVLTICIGILILANIKYVKRGKTRRRFYFET